MTRTPASYIEIKRGLKRLADRVEKMPYVDDVDLNLDTTKPSLKFTAEDYWGTCPDDVLAIIDQEDALRLKKYSQGYVYITAERFDRREDLLDDGGSANE
jgi:hypothetical protein